MTRPAAALSSDLLVRKGLAQPLGLQPTEQTPSDVVRAVRPSLEIVPLPADSVPATEAAGADRRHGRHLARLSGAWSALALRWGLPTMLFIAGVGIIAIVALTGPRAVAPTAEIIAPTIRPPGPTPVSWLDDGLMAYPGLAGR